MAPCPCGQGADLAPRRAPLSPIDEEGTTTTTNNNTRRKTVYRYRWNGGTTRGALKRIDRALARVGEVQYIKGYRYRGRYGSTEAVLIVGDAGSARFSGFCWGYRGEGPHGLVELLKRFIHLERAEAIAFTTKRHHDLGIDWYIRLLPGGKVLHLDREQIDALRGAAIVPGA